MRLASLITEAKKKEKKVEYGCVMLNLDIADSSISKWHSCIDKKDIYKKSKDGRKLGLETEPYITILYGLDCEVSAADVSKKFADHRIKFEGYYVLNRVNCFECPEYDVLKFDVMGDSLELANTVLKEFPHHSEFREYCPHLTIAYLKKGTGRKYVDMFRNEIYYKKVTNVVFSDSKRNKTNINIK